MIAVARPRTRQVVPSSVAPNFRDYGKTVDAPLLRLVGRLAARHGEAFASEAGLRFMICEDSGHMPGVGTVPAALERLAAQGLVQQVWLKAGGILPDGSVCTHGTRLIVLSRGRRQRRTARVANRRAEATQRRVVAHDLQAAIAAVARPLASTTPRAHELDARREEQLRAARELAARWDAEDKPPK